MLATGGTVAVGGVQVQKPAPGLAPWAPQQGPWDTRMASHLLRRAGFGGRPEEIDAKFRAWMREAYAVGEQHHLD